MARLIQVLQNTLRAADPLASNETRRIYLKETLQAFVLEFIYNHPVYRKLNFYGGTCLHVLFGLDRLSEDIDLDNSGGIDLLNFPDDLTSQFHKRLGYLQASTKVQESVSGITRVTLRLPVLYELGLSAHQDEMLHLKIEISHHQQVAVIQRTPTIHYGRSFVPTHFSLETLMAGKMLACLERSFQVGSGSIRIKGRDFYDLIWFMQQRIQPMEEKLRRDGAAAYSIKSAMLALEDKVDKIKKRDLEIDLLPLFEQRAYIEAWIESFHTSFNTYLQSYL